MYDGFVHIYAGKNPSNGRHYDRTIIKCACVCSNSKRFVKSEFPLPFNYCANKTANRSGELPFQLKLLKPENYLKFEWQWNEKKTKIHTNSESVFVCGAIIKWEILRPNQVISIFVYFIDRISHNCLVVFSKHKISKNATNKHAQSCDYIVCMCQFK